MSKFTDAWQLLGIDDDQAEAVEFPSDDERLKALGIDPDEFCLFVADHAKLLCEGAGGYVTDSAVELITAAMVTAVVLGTEYGRLTADTEVPR